MTEAVIVATARSPIGRAFKGSLKDLRPDDLTLQIVRTVMDKVPELDPRDLSDLVLGCGAPAGESGWNMARIIAVLAGYDHLPGTTVTRFCSSSLQATRMAFHAIKADEGDAYLVAGVEKITPFSRGTSEEDAGPDLRNPRFNEARAHTEQRLARAGVWCDPRTEGYLPDVYMSMLQTAENVQHLTGVSREEQDAFAVRSQHLTQQGLANGFWARDITPVTLPGEIVISADDCPRAGVTMQSLSQLQPVLPNGTVTAGNACPLNDGAAALIVMSDRMAKDLGLTPLARIVSTGVTGLSPEIMGLGPVEATKQALERAKMSVDDIDLFEINEAFAVQVLASAHQIGIPLEKLNVNGGAISIGHPFGMTGARIINTLMNSFQTYDKDTAVETMCVGGGMGMAMVFERLS